MRVNLLSIGLSERTCTTQNETKLKHMKADQYTNPYIDIHMVWY